MKAERGGVAKLVLDSARLSLEKDLGKIEDCLRRLSTKDIWWRPNVASNSAGNLCLHLCGNMRQWIISGLGGAADVRVRDEEFSEQGPLARRVLVGRLRDTVREAGRVLERLPAGALTRNYAIQGFHVTGYGAVAQVVQHFSYHAGQIIYLTKMRGGRDLRLTTLSAVTKAR
jgi:hypothetical protein